MNVNNRQDRSGARGQGACDRAHFGAGVSRPETPVLPMADVSPPGGYWIHKSARRLFALSKRVRHEARRAPSPGRRGFGVRCGPSPKRSHTSPCPSPSRRGDPCCPPDV
ncbi:hypothetical protein RSM1_29365 [Methylobacterium radiotolerans]|nr:hypothetical protein RSM1_29365 [Methylobacterium radiotolerans]